MLGYFYRRFRIIGFCFVIFFPSLSFGKEIKIGVILPLTGPAGKYGKWARDGIELAVEEIRKTDPSLKVIFEDNEGNPSKGVSAFLKLVKADKVPVVMDLILSQVALAVAPVAERNKVVMLSIGASAEKLKYAGDYVFRIRESSREHSRKAAEYALRITKVAGVIFLNAENGLS